MTPGAIGRRYGRALFELASEAGEAEAVGQALAVISEAVDMLEGGSLAPGALTIGQREQLVGTLSSGAGGGALLGRFLGVLAANDRLDQLPAIRRRFDRMGDESAGRVRILIRSASELSPSERTALRIRFETITGKKVFDTAVVDPDLLGGVTVEAEGRVYDGSIRSQLARLERRMAG